LFKKWLGAKSFVEPMPAFDIQEQGKQQLNILSVNKQL